MIVFRTYNENSVTGVKKNSIPRVQRNNFSELFLMLTKVFGSLHFFFRKLSQIFLADIIKTAFYVSRGTF